MNEYQSNIYQLALKWRMNLLTNAELREFEQWFRMLEDVSLGFPIEITVDTVEKRLHEMISDGMAPNPDDPNSPPYPL